MKPTTYEEFVTKATAVHGDLYTYHIASYTSVADKVSYTCRLHGETESWAGSLLQGHGCKACGAQKSLETKKGKAGEHLAVLKRVHPTYGFPDYEANFTRTIDKSRVVCPEHGEFMAATSHLKKGKGCPKCGRLKTAEGKAWSKGNVAVRLSKLGKVNHTYKTETFTGYYENMTAVCSEHGEFVQTVSCFAQGVGCGICARLSNSRKVVRSSESLLAHANQVHENKYTYPKPLTGVAKLWEIECPTHGTFSQLGYVHLRGSQCPTCAGMGSKGQRELLELVRGVHPDAVSDYRFSKTSRQQIDVYIPSLKIGFEYDGIYWHSSKFKESGWHRDKQASAAAEGIALFQLFSDEWERPAAKKLVMDRITRTKPLYARKCKVVEIAYPEARAFHEENHIQGSNLYGTSFALLYEDSPVAVMTFTHVTSERGTTSQVGSMELARYSTAVKVIGGASKLLAHAVRAMQLTKLISYSDNRLFTGGMYEKLGFVKVHTTPPNYSYCAPNEPTRLHKANFRHSKLPSRLGNLYNPSLTEKANCEAAGYYQVYDCGLTKWSWTLTKESHGDSEHQRR